MDVQALYNIRAALVTAKQEQEALKSENKKVWVPPNQAPSRPHISVLFVAAQ